MEYKTQLQLEARHSNGNRDSFILYHHSYITAFECRRMVRAARKEIGIVGNENEFYYRLNDIVDYLTENFGFVTEKVPSEEELEIIVLHPEIEDKSEKIKGVSYE